MGTETPESVPHDLGSDANKYAATSWDSGIGKLEDLRCPSGQLCLIRRVGPQGLMEAGILENVDTLTAMIQKMITKSQGKKPQDRKRKGAQDNEITDADVVELLKRPEDLAEIMGVVNKAVIHCVVEPKLYNPPEDPKERVEGQVYIDQVDLNDRMFIFNYVVGGTRDLETFREQSEASVGSVEAKPSTRRKTK